MAWGSKPGVLQGRVEEITIDSKGPKWFIMFMKLKKNMYKLQFNICIILFSRKIDNIIILNLFSYFDES